jgi:hypothetical protein
MMIYACCVYHTLIKTWSDTIPGGERQGAMAVFVTVSICFGVFLFGALRMTDGIL